jgi:hypothetical protein
MNDETESLRSPRNEYPGYVTTKPGHLKEGILRLDFNPVIRSEVERTTIERFALRIFERPDDYEFGGDRVEVSVSLSVEQWQDLIDAMKAELEMARYYRKDFEDLQSPPDDEPESPAG